MKIIPPHTLTNFEVQKNQNQPKFIGAYSRNNLPEIKNEEYVIDCDIWSINLKELI